MLSLLTLALLAASPIQPGGIPGHSDGRCRETRTRRDRACSPGAIFEFAPASGAGMTAECACTAPAASTGQTITSFVRGSSAYCTKGPLATGIDVGDLVQCTANQPLVTAGDASGVSGLLVERAATNDCLQSQTLENAAWTSLATVTANAALAPDNTLTAEQLSDVSAVAVQGSTQVIATTAARQHAFGCYVRAGTATSATISMTGTDSATGDCAATFTGLSSTTWARLQCGSPSAYAGTLTAVSVFVGVGSVAADTGTLFVWGCQHESDAVSAQPFVTSYVPTVATSATRSATTFQWSGVLSTPINIAVVNQGSTAATYVLQGLPPVGSLVYVGNAGRLLYFDTGFLAMYDGTTGPLRASGATAFVARRAASSWSGATQTVFDVTGGLSSSAAFDGTMASDGTFNTGYSVASGQLNGVIKQVCLSSNPGFCR